MGSSVGRDGAARRRRVPLALPMRPANDGGPPNIEDPDDAAVTCPVADGVEVRMTLYWDHGRSEDSSKPLPWPDFARLP